MRMMMPLTWTGVTQCEKYISKEPVLQEKSYQNIRRFKNKTIGLMEDYIARLLKDNP
jgi:hypothetical protein